MAPNHHASPSTAKKPEIARARAGGTVRRRYVGFAEAGRTRKSETTNEAATTSAAPAR